MENGPEQEVGVETPKIRHGEKETYLPWDNYISLVMKVHLFLISWLSLVRETVSSEAEELEYQRYF
jgi:hypothetical protein